MPVVIPLIGAATGALTAGGIDKVKRQFDTDPANNPSVSDWLTLLAAMAGGGLLGGWFGSMGGPATTTGTAAAKGAMSAMGGLQGAGLAQAGQMVAKEAAAPTTATTAKAATTPKTTTAASSGQAATSGIGNTPLSVRPASELAPNSTSNTKAIGDAWTAINNLGKRTGDTALQATAAKGMSNLGTVTANDLAQIVAQAPPELKSAYMTQITTMWRQGLPNEQIASTLKQIKPIAGGANSISSATPPPGSTNIQKNAAGTALSYDDRTGSTHPTNAWLAQSYQSIYQRALETGNMTLATQAANKLAQLGVKLPPLERGVTSGG